MEKSKLLSITKRIYEPSYKSLSPNECYDFFKQDTVFKVFRERMEAEDIIMISFLLPFAENSDLSSLYDNIKYNMFVYSYFEIIDIEVYTECESCYGSGNEDCTECGGGGNVECYECGGRGNTDCEYCDGTGEQEDGESCSECYGSGNEDCTECGGGGEVECNECGGNGSFSCSGCEGTGEVEESDMNEIYQYYFVCYNQKIKDILLQKEEYQLLSDDTERILRNNKKTLLFKVAKEKVSISWEYGGLGDFLFVAVEDSPTFYKLSKDDIDVKEIWDVV
jgi:hypothetical protein